MNDEAKHDEITEHLNEVIEKLNDANYESDLYVK